ncbi:DNA-binding transcriptional MerR regulator [Lachnospiraceae bacterium PF1-22]|uniref:MerR family transcriptional regulator n=1 Tax=Ohessyouella blattaphilus TaxID=2949333 RepID=UPI003E1A35DC
MMITIQKLASMAGVSTRTLRYYDQTKLLTPAAINEAGYRLYSQQEIDRLWQILFYKERGLSLGTIKDILDDPDYDARAALTSHLKTLKEERSHLDLLIDTVEKTISERKGNLKMKNEERFEVFKQQLVDENEETYGDEIRETYGDEKIDKANQKMLKMTEAEYKQFQELGEKILTSLEQAVQDGASPEDEVGKEITSLHTQWLKMTWPASAYTKEAHQGLGEMYVADERFQAFYDKHVAGCATFLRDSLKCWL